MRQPQKKPQSATPAVVVRLARSGKNAVVVTPEMKAQLKDQAASTSATIKRYPELSDWQR